jgi:hypothetical protein
VRAMKRIIVGIASCLIGISIFSQDAAVGLDRTQGPYMGEIPPGLDPKIFAEGFVSVPGRYATSICFSKDCLECYITVRNAAFTVLDILATRYEKGQWTVPAKVAFSDGLTKRPSLADKDQTLYFGEGPHIYKAMRTATGWSAPERLPAPVNSPREEYTFELSDLGNAWICSWRTGGAGGCDIWRIEPEDGKLAKAVNQRELNTLGNDCSGMPGPNESYVLWQSDRPGGFGGMDVYISYADGHGGWSPPENLGPSINTSANEGSPFLSPDGKYLFFSRETANGSDIYWVSVKAFLTAR